MGWPQERPNHEQLSDANEPIQDSKTQFFDSIHDQIPILLISETKILRQDKLVFMLINYDKNTIIKITRFSLIVWIDSMKALYDLFVK
jgi:hypothetical protein